MTLSHLNDCMIQNELEPLSIIPRYSEDNQTALTNKMLNQWKKIHSTAEHVDLVAPIVSVLCRKK